MNAGRRTAMVMAASKGLGRGAAEALAGSGHDLVLCARSGDQLEETAAAIRSSDTRVEVVPANVAEPTDLEAVVDKAVEVFGGVDVLVANAGGPRPGTFLDLSDASWQEAYELTFLSAVRAIRAVLPDMCQKGFGRIVVIGSSSVLSPLPNLTLSNAFRPALAGLVSSLAQEVAESGVTVNLVVPGRIDTDRVRELDEMRAAKSGTEYTRLRAQSEQGIPARRYGRPDEIGALVAFLASDAAAYLTGQSLVLDGGLVPRNP